MRGNGFGLDVVSSQYTTCLVFALGLPPRYCQHLLALPSHDDEEASYRSFAKSWVRSNGGPLSHRGNFIPDLLLLEPGPFIGLCLLARCRFELLGARFYETSEKSAP
eukprot:3393108-Heterocapsa_arctica.AAC.1